MTRLLIDLGNTRLKWRCDDGAAVLDAGAVVHRGRALNEALAALPATLPRPAVVWCGSVAGAEADAILDACVQARWSLRPRFAHASAAACGVRNAYAEPARMGVDRWLALIGAHALVPGASCVVDAGTAVTVDALDANGVHRGGTILPGLQLMRGTLYGNTGRIPPEPVPAADGLGCDTAACVAAGVLHAVAGGIERSVASATAVLGAAPVCLLTGGDAPLLATVLHLDTRVVPDLVLDGLARLSGA